MFSQLPKRANSLIDIDFVNFMERGGSLIDMDDLMESNDVPAREFRQFESFLPLVNYEHNASVVDVRDHAPTSLPHTNHFSAAHVN